jgi:hypothetical protein
MMRSNQLSQREKELGLLTRGIGPSLGLRTLCHRVGHNLPRHQVQLRPHQNQAAIFALPKERAIRKQSVFRNRERNCNLGIHLAFGILTFAMVPSLSKQQITVVLPSDSNKLVDRVSDSLSHLVNKEQNLLQTASTWKSCG